MNIGELKETVAAYVQKPLAELTIGGVDLVLKALNNAKKKAERLHDWNCEEATVVGTATAGVGSWQNLPLLSGGDPIKVKQPVTFFLSTEGNLLPLFHHTKTLGAIRVKERIQRLMTDFDTRYGRDDEPTYRLVTNFNNRAPYQVYVHGAQYQMYPVPTEDKTIVIDVDRWLPDYTSDDDEDFFTEHGADYLMYAAIVEINMLTQTFVPQTEGNLAPPEKARDEAYAGLVEYDNFLVQRGRQPEAF